MKKKKEKRDGWVKVMDLVEKEIALFDKRPRKMRKIHPSGDCYMNEILQAVEDHCMFNIRKNLKMFARELDRDFMDDTGENARNVILSRLKVQLKSIK